MGVTQFPASSSGSRFVTKVNTAGADQLGAMTSVASGTGAYGGWNPITTTASELYIVSFTATTTSTGLVEGANYTRFQIGIGAFGSEVALTTITPIGVERPLPTTDFVVLQQDLPVPLRVGSGQAVSVQAWANGLFGFNVRLFAVAAANVEGG